MQGTAFGENGQTYQFQYGSNGVPNRTAAGGVRGCIGSICEGGDLSNVVQTGISLNGSMRREVAYGRISYEVTDAIEVYGTASLANVYTTNQPNLGAPKSANLTIQCTNPFLPADVVAACAANNITSFQFGTVNANLPENIEVTNDRRQRRYVFGAVGKFALLGSSWDFDAYFQDSTTKIDYKIYNMTLNSRYNAAIDAVLDPASGQIVCRSAVARAAGCIPFNVIGNSPVNMAAVRYFTPANGPRNHTLVGQRVAAISFNGTPFETWAGQVAVAFGAEWRQERYHATADPYGNGVMANSPNSLEYPADPVLNSVVGNNWFAANYHNGRGKYSVKEAFLEVVLPLVNSDALGKAELNLGGRATDYSTSGRVNTWKIGATWDTPIEGVRLRGVRSRDVRAPNLSELYAAPAIQNVNVTNRTTNNVVTAVQTTTGNVNLKPEVSQNTQAGIVFRPDWLQGFQASVDWYKISISGAISSLTGQQLVDLCQIGANASACPNVFLAGGPPGSANPSFVNLQPFNLASIKTSGIDFEVSYRFDMDRVGLPGTLTLRALATHVSNFKTKPGIPGQPDIQAAGGGTIPSWRGYFTQSWTSGKLTLTAVERWFSDGKINPNWIECQAPNCPVPTLQNPTVDYNRLPGQIFLDIGGSYEFRKDMELYFKVDNLTNRTPHPDGATFWNFNAQNYDYIGRTIRVGARFSL